MNPLEHPVGSTGCPEARVPPKSATWTDAPCPSGSSNLTTGLAVNHVSNPHPAPAMGPFTFNNPLFDAISRVETEGVISSSRKRPRGDCQSDEASALPTSFSALEASNSVKAVRSSSSTKKKSKALTTTTTGTTTTSSSPSSLSSASSGLHRGDGIDSGPPPAKRPCSRPSGSTTSNFYSSVLPFVSKAWDIVHDPSTNDIVSWSEDGTSFTVFDETIFAKAILPKFFKHNNFCSFVRQLNTYGFAKVNTGSWEFRHPSFLRDSPNELVNIYRKKPQKYLVTTTANAAAATAAGTAPATTPTTDHNVSTSTTTTSSSAPSSSSPSSSNSSVSCSPSDPSPSVPVPNSASSSSSSSCQEGAGAVPSPVKMKAEQPKPVASVPQEFLDEFKALRDKVDVLTDAAKQFLQALMTPEAGIIQGLTCEQLQTLARFSSNL